MSASKMSPSPKIESPVSFIPFTIPLQHLLAFFPQRNFEIGKEVIFILILWNLKLHLSWVK
jgi:hypothetical protein